MTVMLLLHKTRCCGWQQACYPTCSPAVWMLSLRLAAWEPIPKPRWPRVAGVCLLPCPRCSLLPRQAGSGKPALRSSFPGWKLLANGSWSSVSYY